MITEKSKVHEILEAHIMENKYQGLGFDKHVPTSISAPSASKATPKSCL